MSKTPLLEQQIQAIDLPLLTPVVRQLFLSEPVEVLDWHLKPIQFDIYTPFTLGLYRIRGTARAQENNLIRPWSVVLKIIYGPAFVPEEIWKAPDSFIYLQRETLTYSSAIRASLPDCIGMPVCYGVTELEENLIWLWMEDISDSFPSGWPLDRFVLAARHLGILNGNYLNKAALPDYPWLNRNFLRNWISFYTSETRMERLKDNATWEHPKVRCAFPTPVAWRFLKLVEKTDLLVDMLDRLPQVLCHLDANCGNLFARHDEKDQEQTVMIDWAWTGINAVGLELVQLLWSSVPKQIAAYDRNQVEAAAFENYLVGLQQVGWDGDETIIQFGYLASLFCRQGLSRMDWTLNLTFDEVQQAKLEQNQQRPITEILAERGAEVYCFVERGEEALRLMDKISALL